MSYLSRVDEYLHAAPLSGATGQQVGPFTLFRSTTVWPYYARPVPGSTATVTVADLEKLRARCEELKLPLSLEWVVDTCPSLAPAAAEAGLEVHEYPLLVLERADFTPVTTSLDCQILTASPDVLRQARAVADTAFGTPGTAIGDGGPEARDVTAAGITDDMVAALVERAEAGVSITAGVFSNQGMLASGVHQPVGTTSEIVGVATLPAMRRQGLAAAITTRLVEHALANGVDLVLLSAESDAVAAVYERVGFHRIGRAGSAELAE
ncbi:GNAT family N-acetyltransferase [Streptomyces sp. SID13031]|uniref:GNAT family N-acetyltransferase n=1 Tax=Streptomyces sp. SID13031 TaxID=2706046 RepID=UPI0013CC46F4|nr:GNAT family N-acetyltransferase [Streptomyces sp. SID13031]NEA34230.1 GNAT family N-acetyltransferase [Streptomyces sp. SID13031]